MSTARIGYKSRLAYEDSPGAGTYTEIANIRTCKPGDPQADEIEFTNQDSLNFRKEFMLTMIDGGSVTCEGNYLPENVTHQQLRILRDNQAMINWRINIRDATLGSVIQTITFAGQVKSFTLGELAPNSLQSYALSVRVSGAETWVP
jgi:hypothetical protein